MRLWHPKSVHQKTRRGRENPFLPPSGSGWRQTFDIATKKAANSDDFDYLTELFSQCVLGDPGNSNYVQGYIENLQKKYNNNKKGSPFAQFKERGSRSALKKALAQQHWDEAIKHGLKVLAVNPWDVPTLTGMATAAGKSGDFECEFVLSQHRAPWPIPGIPPSTGFAAWPWPIAESWTRPSPAGIASRRPCLTTRRPNGRIAVLVEQRLRAKGGYDEGDTAREVRVRGEQQAELNLEQKMRQKIEQEPQTVAHYLDLAQYYLNAERFGEAEDLLAKAYELSDGDTDIREKWEDAQLRHLRQRLAKTHDPAAKKKLQQEYYEKDLAVCKNRVERYPEILAFKYDLGYRYLLTKQYTEAIPQLQLAQNDPRKKGLCMLVLGQCFEQIKQYKMAMTQYEAAIHEIPDRDAENKRRALYRAGRLALRLRNIETAEKYLTTLAGLDFSYRDVKDLLDKVARLRENPRLDE